MLCKKLHTYILDNLWKPILFYFASSKKNDASSKKRCISTQESIQESTRFEIIPLSILGFVDQQNLEHFLSDFKWSGHRLAHVFAYDGWMFNSITHTLNWPCWNRPQGHYFSITKTSSKRLCTRYCWINMVCRRSGWSSSTGDRTQMREGNFWPAAQNRSCARGSRGGAKQRCGNGKE